MGRFGQMAENHTLGLSGNWVRIDAEQIRV